MSERRLLYLEPIGGIAGDMFLAAALELGVSQAALVEALRGLGVPGWTLKASKAARHGIAGTHVDVELDASASGVERSLGEIRRLICDASSLSSRAKERALAIFEVIGRAEAKVHGVHLDAVHLHEVGGIDSIVDVCGAAVALELLGEPLVYCAPPPLGSGQIETAHGALPVPAPATLEILRDTPVRFEGVGELTTPTGAALIKALAQVRPPPELIIERTGYGIGTKDFADRPNVLRASLGKPAHSSAEGTFVVETNLDDCSPQLLGALVEGLLEKGALDAYIVPAIMKKGRPGHLLGAIVPSAHKELVVDWLLTESTTLGVRVHRVERVALERSFEVVKTPYGEVRMKLGWRNGEVVNAMPEFDDCRARARESGAPIKQVWAAALAASRGRV